MKLFICGNGMDIHVGLKTSYGAYREYLKNDLFIDRKRAISVIENSAFFIDPVNDDWSSLEMSLSFDIDKYIKMWMDAFDRDMSHYDRENTNEQIRLANSFFDNDPEKIAFDFTNEWFGVWLSLTYHNHIKEIISNYNKILCKLVGDEKDIFVNFNYTPTLEDLFGIEKKRILYIHNRLPDLRDMSKPITHSEFIEDILQSGVKKLQFGSTTNDITEWELKEQSIALKHSNSVTDFDGLRQKINRIYRSFTKVLSENYAELNSFISGNKIEEIIILGHTFDGVDEPYYKDVIIPLFRGVKWHFFCHNGRKRAEEFAIKYQLEDVEFTDW